METAMQMQKEIEALSRMTVGQLRQKYLEVFGEESRSNHKQFLFRRIAWRIQALAEGVLSERARRRALEIANDADLRIRAPRTMFGQANYFGMKKAHRHMKCCTVTTREFVKGKAVIENLEFADYDSLEDSCRDYAWLITNGAPYHAAWAVYQKNGSIEALIAAISRVYASDPRYGGLAITIANQTNVIGAIDKARSGG